MAHPQFANQHHPNLIPAQPSSPPGPSAGSSPSSSSSTLDLNNNSIHAGRYQMLMDGDINGLMMGENGIFSHSHSHSHSQDLNNISDLKWEQDNSTALHIAVSAGQLELISSIISLNNDLLLQPNTRGDLPIHLATRVGQLVAVMRLVDGAANRLQLMMSFENEDKATALHIALENQQEDMATYLFDTYPQAVFQLNKSGISPLYLAIKAGLWRLVKNMLLPQHMDAGDVDHNLSQGRSVVHAAIMARNLEILTTMINNHGDQLIYLTDERGRSPLSYAAFIGFLDGVTYLLDQYPVPAFKVDEDGSFPIHKACSGGNVQVVKEFLNRSPNTKWLLNKKGQNILHVAAANGKADIVNYLLEKSPKIIENYNKLINMKDEDGNTPLHVATMGKHPKVVYVFTWDDRVKLKLQNKEGLTALDMAEDYGQIPSFEERLTWLALRYAGVPRAPQVVLTEPNTSGPMIIIPNNGHLLHSYDHMPTTLPLEIANGVVTHKNYQHHPKRKNNKYKDRINTLLMVSTLVATVTFASGFTVPGGYNDDLPDKGMATLAHKCAFQVFVITNTLAMYCSILADVTLIWAHLDDLQLSLLSLDFALLLLGTALVMMSVAFMVGLYVVLHDLWRLGVVVLVLGGVFLCALLVFFVPLYSPTSPINSKILRCAFHVPFTLMLLTCDKGMPQNFY